MAFTKVFLILAFAFFAESALAGKAYDTLISLHNQKIKETSPEIVASLNNQIHGILGGSMGLSQRILKEAEKTNTAYIAIHAALTTEGTAEDILLQKVFTDANLRYLASPNPKIIIHYVKLAILYIATQTVREATSEDIFKSSILGKTVTLADSKKLPPSLKTALKSVTENEITNTLQRLDFGNIHRYIRRQIHKKWRGEAEIELSGSSSPSIEIKECHLGRGKCGGKGWHRWRNAPPPIPGTLEPEKSLYPTYPGVPPFIGRGVHFPHHERHHGPREHHHGSPRHPPHPHGSHHHGHGHHHGPLPPGMVPHSGHPGPGGFHGRWEKTWLNQFSLPTASIGAEDEDE
ncbi:MAG: hypothetical protein K2Q34_04690 [Alphaproteobacteria bacterium]|nr:hypothetical protein [Alphaproteobacteria bacterium]